MKEDNDKKKSRMANNEDAEIQMQMGENQKGDNNGKHSSKQKNYYKNKWLMTKANI